MKYSKQLRQWGKIATAPKQGKKTRDKEVTEINKIKEICLNCKRPKCDGRCKEFKKVNTDRKEAKG